MPLSMSNFPQKLHCSTRRILTLDQSRLLLSVKDSFDLSNTPSNHNWRRTTIETITKLLRGIELEIEEDHYGGGANATRPQELINHTERRIWVRSHDKSRITNKSLQLLEKKKNTWLEWYAPVYQRGKMGRRTGLMCPLPDVLVVPTRLMRDSDGCDLQTASTRLSSDYALAKTQDDEHEPDRLGLKNDYRCYRVKEPNREDAYQTSRKLRKGEKKWGAKVSYVLMPMIDPIAQFPQGPPNDSLYKDQWSLQRIAAESGWKRTRGDQKVIIAVIDEGCDFNHPEFARTDATGNSISRDALVDGATFYADGSQVAQEVGDSQYTPSQSHGTKCAGIIGADINNGRVIAGLAPDCRILPIRLSGGKTSIALANAIKFAVTNQTNPAKVVSISLASSAYNSDDVKEAIDLAYSNDAVVCCASGNADSSELEYPAAYARDNAVGQPRINSVIACGACNRTDERCSSSTDWGSGFGSNYGPGLSVVAPGNDIVTLSSNDRRVGGAWTSDFGGTSAAVPHVASLAALLLSLKPLTANQVLDIIEQTAEPINNRLYSYDPAKSRHRGSGWSAEVGYGLIKVDAAIQQV